MINVCRGKGGPNFSRSAELFRTLYNPKVKERVLMLNQRTLIKHAEITRFQGRDTNNEYLKALYKV